MVQFPVMGDLPLRFGINLKEVSSFEKSLVGPAKRNLRKDRQLKAATFSDQVGVIFFIPFQHNALEKRIASS